MIVDANTCIAFAYGFLIRLAYASTHVSQIGFQSEALIHSPYCRKCIDFLGNAKPGPLDYRR
jgi:hypothetical protein